MLNKQALLITGLLLVVLYICSNSAKTVIIEPEGFEQNSGFTVQNNRYLMDNRPEDTQLKSTKEEDSQWQTKYTPGANNTTEDLKWLHTSPQMTLVDNKIRWDAYGPEDVYDAPGGLPANGGRLTRNANIMSEYGSYSTDNECDRDLTNRIITTGSMTTGVRDQPNDELSSLINSK